MTEETLRKVIVEAIGEEVARRVSAKLIALQKKALVVCTASTMGFSQWIVGLQQLEQEGFTFDLYLSENAAKILQVSAIRSAVSFGKVWLGETEQPPEAIAAPYYTILVPAMTVNTAAKVANSFCDNPASRLILNSMMKGKNVIIAVDGCCPDNEERAAKGYRMTEPLKAQLRQNLVRLQEFGAVLTAARQVSQFSFLRSSTEKSACGFATFLPVYQQRLPLLPVDQLSDPYLPHNRQPTSCPCHVPLQ